jgi:2-iminoacetate synthase
VDNFQQLIEKARALTRQRFGKTIQLYAPLYLSNECIDICSYCGFSRTNKIPRKTLAVGQVVAEADYLIAQGFRHLLLVSGEHPTHVSPDYLEEIIQVLKPRLASLSIETAPFKEEVYRRLIEAGLDGVVIYQETYDPEVYASVHLAGPKKGYDRRLESPEEAAKAGIRRLGMGILLGLADWQKDAASLIAHVRSLRKKYWQTEITVSLPRLRPCISDFAPPHPVSDREFVELIAAIRLTLPEVRIVLSTRESPSLRDFLIGIGVTEMSAGSKTEPGGYLNPEGTLKQFEIEDCRPAADVAAMIAKKGYEPVWKDWERIGE